MVSAFDDSDVVDAASSRDLPSPERTLIKARPDAQPTSSALHFKTIVINAHAKKKEKKMTGTAESPST